MIAPHSPEQVCEAMGIAAAAGGAIARGAGRSYGDAAQNDGGTVIDLASMRGCEIQQGMLVRAGAGATLGQLIGWLAPQGLTLPVLPGTRHITLGGAIAADVHGKNHRDDGSFAHHVQSVCLCTPDGDLRQVSREREAELFHATVGGMGLTGVIVEAILKPTPLASPLLSADIDRVQSIEQAIEVMGDDEGHRYSIAWLDLLSAGRAFGRSVVVRSRERPATAGERPRQRFTLPGRRWLSVPEAVPGRLLSPAMVRAFNAMHWRGAPTRARGQTISMGANLFPLDSLSHWNRLYGAGGLVQYQFAVPEDRQDLLVEVPQRLRRARQPMYLAVIKRFGEGSGGLLSFPIAGWTLAIDMPGASRGLREALDAVDRLVAAGGGRVYLAKDSRLRAELLGEMYPGLRRFQEIRAAVDPQGLLRSDLGRRLGLCDSGLRSQAPVPAGAAPQAARSSPGAPEAGGAR